MAPRKKRIFLSRAISKKTSGSVKVPSHSTPYKMTCDSCKEETSVRNFVSYKGNEWGLCIKCHTLFKSEFGTVKVDDSNASWGAVKSKSTECRFCHKPIDGYENECNDCRGRIKYVAFRGLGLKRNRPIGTAPADVIESLKRRKKFSNPFHSTSIPIHLGPVNRFDLFSDEEINALYNAQDAEIIRMIDDDFD